jgi:hypothetical protein
MTGGVGSTWTPIVLRGFGSRGSDSTNFSGSLLDADVIESQVVHELAKNKDVGNEWPVRGHPARRSRAAQRDRRQLAENVLDLLQRECARGLSRNALRNREQS